MLTYTDWNKSEAAEILGISVRNIYRKIDQHGLDKRGE
ncbi:helix-turn-helix domain-containing protein [Salisediminibacterium selenitireducens]|nr:helix-turn-helix domain-containing protein [Salisediminibacterium selenitireducens]